jgi:membrane associated rhomboid family serine protease
MLLPLGDDNTMRHITPVVTYTMVGINILVFLYQMVDPGFTYAYSVIPYEITRGEDLVRPVLLRGVGEIPQAPGPTPIYLTFLTAMFMHGGFMHIAGNMLYLWIFGDNVEDRMGHAKFVLFYLLCGVAASATHIFFDASSVIPSLGASGAIAGVLGAYLILFPHQRVRVLIPLGIFSQITELPAIIVIGFWALLQFLSGFGSIAHTTATRGGGVAYMAHVGGFVAGLILVFFFRNAARRAPRYRREFPDEF